MVDGIVFVVNVHKREYIIGKNDSNNRLVCFLSEDNISDEVFPDGVFPFKEGDIVRAIGDIRFNKNNGLVYLNVTYHSTIEHGLLISESHGRYRELSLMLKHDDNNARIKLIQSREFPTKLLNISIVVITNDDNKYAEIVGKISHIVGHIDVYRVTTSYIFDTVQKIKDTQMIYIIGDQLSLEQILELSTKQLLRYMLNSKTVFVMTSMTCTCNYITPLLSQVSARHVCKMEEGINMIMEQQYKDTADLRYIMGLAKTNLMNRLNEMERRLACYEGILQKRVSRMPHVSNISIIKDILTQKLDNELMIIKNKEVWLMKKILGHEKAQAAFKSAITVEKMMDDNGRAKYLGNQQKKIEKGNDNI
jgi:hypothetical protein